MKNIIVLFILSLAVALPASAVDTFVSGEVGQIRQDNINNFVRINLGATIDITGCATKDFATVLEVDNPSFDRMYAAVLLAKGTNTAVQVQYNPDECAVPTATGATFAIAKGIIVE